MNARGRGGVGSPGRLRIRPDVELGEESGRGYVRSEATAAGGGTPMTPLTPTESARRLRVLAAHLVTVPSGLFSMREWVHDLDRDNGYNQPIGCGTAGCAMGHASAILEFRALGLTLNGVVGVPEYDGRYAYEAAAHFFGFSYNVAVHLFSEGSYVDTPVKRPEGKRRVIARLLETAFAIESEIEVTE
jgi:hypothetical protein